MYPLFVTRVTVELPKSQWLPIKNVPEIVGQRHVQILGVGQGAVTKHRSPLPPPPSRPPINLTTSQIHM